MPRDPARIPMILAALEREWHKEPDLRLGQLLVNLVPEAKPSPLFNIADGKLLERLGPQTAEERSYIKEEPAAARAGWREWERAWIAKNHPNDQPLPRPDDA